MLNFWKFSVTRLTKAIHDPIETDDSWITGRSCESISAENSSDGENDETDYDNRKIACGMVAQVLDTVCEVGHEFVL